MAQYEVFSEIDLDTMVAGHNESDECWKWRGVFTAESERAAIAQVAEVDAMTAEIGTERRYAATRVSAWRRQTYVFATTARALDEVADPV